MVWGSPAWRGSPSQEGPAAGLRCRSAFRVPTSAAILRTGGGGGGLALRPPQPAAAKGPPAGGRGGMPGGPGAGAAHGASCRAWGHGANRGHFGGAGQKLHWGFEPPPPAGQQRWWGCLRGAAGPPRGHAQIWHMGLGGNLSGGLSGVGGGGGGDRGQDTHPRLPPPSSPNAHEGPRHPGTPPSKYPSIWEPTLSAGKVAQNPSLQPQNYISPQQGRRDQVSRLGCVPPRTHTWLCPCGPHTHVSPLQPLRH